MIIDTDNSSNSSECVVQQPPHLLAPTYFTVSQFATVEKAFSEAALRKLIFDAQERHTTMGVIPGNGLLESGAVVKLRGRVLIHRQRFLDWLTQQ